MIRDEVLKNVVSSLGDIWLEYSAYWLKYAKNQIKILA